MTLGDDELTRMADTLSAECLIPEHTFCGQCGYNLRYAPYVGVCPECGNGYNARPAVRKGLFTHDQLRVPVMDYVVAVACAGIGVPVLFSGLDPVNDWLILCGGAFTFLGMTFLYRSIRDTARFFHFLGVMRRVEQSGEEEVEA